MQVDDAAGARLRAGNDPISGFRMLEALCRVDVGTGAPAERGRGGREGGVVQGGSDDQPNPTGSSSGYGAADQCNHRSLRLMSF
jgi:hypothetical protein